MNKLQLDVVALAAQADFGITELSGVYHNLAVEYIASHRSTFQMKHLEEAASLSRHFMKQFSPETFGMKDPKTFQKVLKITTSDLPQKMVYTGDWKNDSSLSDKANKSIHELVHLVRSFSDGKKDPAQMKAELIRWQKEHQGINENEDAILAVAGSIARHSGAYWISDGYPQSGGGTTAKKRCLKDTLTVAADVVFGTAGAIAGTVAGGIPGAVIGGVAFGAAGSGFVRFGPLNKL